MSKNGTRWGWLSRQRDVRPGNLLALAVAALALPWLAYRLVVWLGEELEIVQLDERDVRELEQQLSLRHAPVPEDQAVESLRPT